MGHLCGHYNVTINIGAYLHCSNSYIPWTECFPIIGVEEFDAPQLYVYPNPSDGVFTLQFNSNEEKDIRVESLTGNVTYQTDRTKANKIDIDLSNYSIGVYIVQVMTSDGSVFTEKVVYK